MADSTLTIKDATGNLVPVDVRTTIDGDRRQVVLLGAGETTGLLSPATEDTLAAVLTALGALSDDPATQTTLAAILTALGQKLEAGQAVALDAATLTALETVQIGSLPEVEVKNDTGNPLTTTPTGAGDVAGTLTDGRKTVATPGTAVAVRTTLACKWVAVTALTTNTQQVNVGASGVLAASGSSTGTPLAPGQSTTIPVNDAAKVFVDARVAGEGVSFTVGS